MKILIPIILLAALSCSSFATDVIAHRGYTSASKENTLEAIREAWMFEAEIVEVDIHVLKDGKLILFHDNEIADKPVKSLEYSELQAFAVSYHIPTIKEALAEVPAGKSIVLDLKSNSDELYKALVDLVSKEAFDCNIIIQSSSLPFLSSLKQRLPKDFKYHFLTKLERNRFSIMEPSAKDLIADLKDSGILGLSVKGRQFIDQAFVDTIKAAGIRLYVWTINDPVRISHYSKLGVDGIITDNPQAKKYIGEGKAKPKLQ